MRNVTLILDDGSRFHGKSFGIEKPVAGEVVFNTAMTGYPESLTDPSYAGQLMTLTYPLVGNYGVPPFTLEPNGLATFMESEHIHAEAIIVSDYSENYSHWNAVESLGDWLKREQIPGITGIDTRELTKVLREHGVMMGRIAFDDESDEMPEASYADVNYVDKVSCKEVIRYNEGTGKKKVLLVDCGVKHNIIRCLLKRDVEVIRVPWDYDYTGMEFDGLFISNGPGDPDAVSATYEQVAKLIGKVPLFGICLGHQMISLACGATMEKLKFGHRGGNQPVMNLRTGRVEITAQNHGFGLLFDSLGPLVPELSGGVSEHVDDLRFWSQRGIAPVVDNERFGRIQLTHVNLNDGTAEGIALLDHPVFSVQYHPEANPGPTDAHYLFTAFARLMDGDEEYLDIDIASDRLNGWVFGAEEGEAHA